MGMCIEINSLEEMCDLMCNNKLPDRYIQHNYVKCLRCGRVLKTPESRVIGYGATCYKKAMKESNSKLF